MFYLYYNIKKKVDIRKHKIKVYNLPLDIPILYRIENNNSPETNIN